MDFTIVTGMSGAGRSQALKRLEDLGFFCVDNMPPSMLPEFAALCLVNADIQKSRSGSRPSHGRDVRQRIRRYK